MFRAKNAFFAALAVCALIGVLSGCSDAGSSKKGSSASVYINEVTGEVAEEYYEEIDDVNNITEVKTKYGSLFYPQRFEADMKTREDDRDDGCIVEFFAVCDGKEYILFDVSIGIENGQLAGFLTDSKGTERNVFVNVPEIENIDALSSEEQDKLYAMQESVNIIADNLN